MRDEEAKSIDGVLRPAKRSTSRKVGPADKQLLNKKRKATMVAKKKRATVAPAKARQPAPAKEDDLPLRKPVQDKEMGSFVEPEDIEEQMETEKKRKSVKLSKKGQKKLFKAIQKGKVDPNNPDAIRTFAIKYRRKTRVKRGFGIFFLLVLLVAGYFGVRIWNELNSSLSGIFAGGNIFDVVRKDPLKKDINGRTNVLVVGTDGFDEDDKGHPGAGLTDTMMVLSFSEEDGDVFMISLPRDMEVRHVCSGWLGTWYGKLNETYPCALEEPGATFESAAEITMASVGNILGLDIHYFVDVNFRVMIDVVDTLGGITVQVANDGDPRGILDRNFDWVCPNGPYTCFFVRYEKDEIVRLDGEHALALARARGAAGGFGLSRSNFNREINQQRIIIAIMEEAKETDLLASPQKILDLIGSFGRNIETTFKVSEIRTLIDLAQTLSAEGDIASRAKGVPLINDDFPQHTVVNGSGQPLAGQFNFTGIQRLINGVVTGQLDFWSEEALSPTTLTNPGQVW